MTDTLAVRLARAGRRGGCIRPLPGHVRRLRPARRRGGSSGRSGAAALGRQAPLARRQDGHLRDAGRARRLPGQRGGAGRRAGGRAEGVLLRGRRHNAADGAPGSSACCRAGAASRPAAGSSRASSASSSPSRRRRPPSPSGLMTGLLPCPIVVGFLALSLQSGSVLTGMATMAAMGVGTVWSLLLLGMTGYALQARTRRWGAVVGGIVLVLLGTVTILRGTGAMHHLMGHHHAAATMQMEMPEPPATRGLSGARPVPRRTCAHCGLPVLTPRGGVGPFYCCYGCSLASRIVGGGDGRRARGAQAWNVLRLGVGAFLAMNVMMISLLLYTGEAEAASVPVFRWVLLGLATPAALILGYPFALGAAAEVRRGRLSLDTPDPGGLLHGVRDQRRQHRPRRGPHLLRHGHHAPAAGHRGEARRGQREAPHGRTRARPGRPAAPHGDRASRRTVPTRSSWAPCAPATCCACCPAGGCPSDGTIEDGASTIEEAAFTGESRPRQVAAGDARLRRHGQRRGRPGRAGGARRRGRAAARHRAHGGGGGQPRLALGAAGRAGGGALHPGRARAGCGRGAVLAAAGGAGAGGLRGAGRDRGGLPLRDGHRHAAGRRAGRRPGRARGRARARRGRDGAHRPASTRSSWTRRAR